jgi:hypothetical protein
LNNPSSFELRDNHRLSGNFGGLAGYVIWRTSTLPQCPQFAQNRKCRPLLTTINLSDMNRLIGVTVAAAVLIAVSFSIAQCAAQENARTGSGQYCKQTSFGSCRTVHGLYGIYVENNGIIDLRTHELFSTAGDGKLDAMIRVSGDEFDHEIYGEFIVCPTSARHRPEHTKSVQMVCVQSYRDTKVVRSRRQ